MLRMAGIVMNLLSGRKVASIVVLLVLLCSQIEAFTSSPSIATRPFTTPSVRITRAPHASEASSSRKIALSAHEGQKEEGDVSESIFGAKIHG